MPQGPLAVYEPFPGGVSTTENVTAAAVVKATTGVLVRIIVINPGTAGSLVINDSATVGGATTANEIFTGLYSALTTVAPIFLQVRTTNGISVSAVPTGGQFVITYN